MMHGKIQRFDFGGLRDFKQPLEFIPLAPIEEEAPPPPPPPTFSEEELKAARDAAREEGYQEGYIAGEKEAKAHIEALHQQTQHTITGFTAHLNELTARYHATLAQQSGMLTELVLAIAQKVAGDALQSRSGVVIAELLNRCLPSVLAKPRLIIELHPETLPHTESVLREAIDAQHYEGEVQFRSNPTLGLHDVRIDWENGHAERSTAELWEEIAALVRHMPMQLELAEAEPQTTTLTGESDGR